jgi:hypothetical protein
VPGPRAHFVDGRAVRVEVRSGGAAHATAPTLAMPPHNRLTGLDGIGGHPAFCAVLYRRLRKLARAAFDAAGRDPDDVSVALSGQGKNTGYMMDMARYCVAAGWPIDAVCPAPYNNAAADRNESTTGWNDPTLADTLDTDRVLDTLEIQVAWNDWEAPLRDLRRDLDAMGLGDVPIDCYEAGIETIKPGDMVLNTGPADAALRARLAADYRAQTRAIYHPRFRRIVWAYLDSYNRAGVSTYNEFQMGDAPHGDGLNHQVWTKLCGPAMRPGAGDGSDGAFDNRADLLGLDRVVSPAYQAFADWNAPAAPPPAPTRRPGRRPAGRPPRARRGGR